MRRWGLHLIAICGGAALVFAAEVVQQMFFNPRTLTVAWNYFILSRTLWALAGFFLLAPVVWAKLRGHRRIRVQWGLLSAYLVAGLVMASAHPLSVGMYTLGVTVVGDSLRGWASAPYLGIFGAILVGAGIAHAFGTQPGPDKQPVDR